MNISNYIENRKAKKTALVTIRNRNTFINIKIEQTETEQVSQREKKTEMEHGAWLAVSICQLL